MTLVKMASDHYVVFSSDGDILFRGSFLGAKRSLYNMGTPASEIAIAVDAMNTTGDEVAHFGITHYFTHTTSKQTYLVSAA